MHNIIFPHNANVWSIFLNYPLANLKSGHDVLYFSWIYSTDLEDIDTCNIFVFLSWYKNMWNDNQVQKINLPTKEEDYFWTFLIMCSYVAIPYSSSSIHLCRVMDSHSASCDGCLSEPLSFVEFTLPWSSLKCINVATPVMDITQYNLTLCISDIVQTLLTPSPTPL